MVLVGTPQRIEGSMGCHKGYYERSAYLKSLEPESLKEDLKKFEAKLAALQHSSNTGAAVGDELWVTYRALWETWDTLDKLIRTDYRQSLHREGDQSGRMLTWLLKRECPPPVIRMLRRPDGTSVNMQQTINDILRVHLVQVY